MTRCILVHGICELPKPTQYILFVSKLDVTIHFLE